MPKGGDSVWGCQQAAASECAYSNHVTEARWGSWGPGGQGQEALAEISLCFISCSRGSPLSFSPVATKEEH